MEDQLVLKESDALRLIKAAMKLGEIKSLPIEQAEEIFFKIKRANGSREETLSYYQSKFVKINKYFTEEKIFETKQINDQVIEQMILSLIGTCNNRYINKLTGAIKHLMYLLAEKNYIEPITFKIKKLKEKEKEIKVLELHELKEIVKFVEREPIQRNIATKLLIETGVRRTECVNIKTKNIDLINNRILLEHTKNHEARYIYISDETNKLIKNFNPKNEYLFWNDKTNQKNTSHFIDELFKKIKKELDYNNLTPHLLRHTFCTYLARSNKLDIKSLGELMGHKTVEITLKYIHSDKEELANASRQLNPLNLL